MSIVERSSHPTTADQPRPRSRAARWLTKPGWVIMTLACLTIVLITIYIVLPALSLAIQAIALTHLGLSVHRERLARPIQTRVPAIKGLDYQSAVTTLRGSHLNIRVLATRYDLPQQPGTIVDQSPAPGEQVDYNYAVGVTITDTAFPRATYTCKFSSVALSSPSVPRTLTLSSGSSSNRHSSTQPMRKRGGYRVGDSLRISKRNPS